MKKYFIVLLTILLGSCEVVTIELPESFAERYIDIEDEFSTKDFEKLTGFIIENGELYYGELAFKYDSSLYVRLGLKPDVATPVSDATVADFNRMNLLFYKNGTSKKGSSNLMIVREGDLGDSTLFYTVPEGMREGKVYITNYFHEDVDTIKANTLACIKDIKKAMRK